ncbi:site-specific integrase [Mucilaginibacter sp. X4EP1]|uniref:site-specific integrase n=1 Tax=Mucilaginibacter sp. X4EP1 TaxID=2723092 RepID=UPI00216A5E39|nr:site-specific integrase [Mucilaginibacter sp. X4EP1]MCS3811438.1 site-specific recombinase XerD [Mucilaginibacter sp. X4EP1]
MELNYSLLFYLKKPKNYTNGPIPVYMRFTINGIPKECATTRTADPEKWCAKTGRETGKTEPSRSLNFHMDDLQQKVHNVHAQMVRDDDEITAASLRDKFLGRDKPQNVPQLLEIFRLHNTQMKELIGKEFEENTLKGYRTCLLHLTGYIQKKYKSDDLAIKRLDYNFINDFNHYLKLDCGIQPISAAKYLKHLKKVVNNYILKPKLLRDNPFSEFKSKAKVKEREFLSQLQLTRLMKKEFTIGRVANVRDIFVFCCYTGLSYADVKKLTRNEIMTGIDGGKWIFTHRKKNDNSSRIPLLKPALQIIAKYKDHPKCVNEDVVLPVLSNQKMNSYLKEIADACDIKQNLTFHLSRHTFATTVALTNGVPIESVSKMLGHVDIKTTQHYAKVIDTKVSQDMKKLSRKLDKMAS